MQRTARKRWIKQLLKNFLALFIGLAIGFVILEVFLRIWDPFHFSVSGNNIVLLSNYKTVLHPKIDKVDETVYFSRNRLGLRGDELPASTADPLSIITVGGSTTECKFLSDSNTWTELLKKKLAPVYPNIWMNNAGFDGHSTMGHLILVRDHLARLHPDYILFLTGANEIELNGYDIQERQVMKTIDFSSFRNFYLSVCNHSKAASLVLNLYRYHLSSRKGLTHNESNLTSGIKKLSKEERSARMNAQGKYLDAYRNRLEALISLCQSQHIKPIFITQPYLGGDFTDSLTGKFMGEFEVGKFNSSSEWEVLEKYNDVIRALSTRNIQVIDLAAQMPKNSKYYYDFVHFTNKGAEKVAEILFLHLKDSLSQNSSLQ